MTPSLPSQSKSISERTRAQMVELSIPAGADAATLVDRIGAEMSENEKLRDLLRRAYRICGPNDLAADIEKAVPDV